MLQGLILLQHGDGAEAVPTVLLPTSHGPLPLLPAPSADQISLLQARGFLPSPVKGDLPSGSMQNIPEFQAYIGMATKIGDPL